MNDNIKQHRKQGLEIKEIFQHHSRLFSNMMILYLEQIGCFAHQFSEKILLSIIISYQRLSFMNYPFSIAISSSGVPQTKPWKVFLIAKTDDSSDSVLKGYDCRFSETYLQLDSGSYVSYDFGGSDSRRFSLSDILKGKRQVWIVSDRNLTSPCINFTLDQIGSANIDKDMTLKQPYYQNLQGGNKKLIGPQKLARVIFENVDPRLQQVNFIFDGSLTATPHRNVQATNPAGNFIERFANYYKILLGMNKLYRITVQGRAGFVSNYDRNYVSSIKSQGLVAALQQNPNHFNFVKKILYPYLVKIRNPAKREPLKIEEIKMQWPNSKAADLNEFSNLPTINLFLDTFLQRPNLLLNPQLAVEFSPLTNQYTVKQTLDSPNLCSSGPSGKSKRLTSISYEFSTWATMSELFTEEEKKICENQLLGQVVQTDVKRIAVKAKQQILQTLSPEALLILYSQVKYAKLNQASSQSQFMKRYPTITKIENLSQSEITVIASQFQSFFFPASADRRVYLSQLERSLEAKVKKILSKNVKQFIEQLNNSKQSAIEKLLLISPDLQALLPYKIPEFQFNEQLLQSSLYINPYFEWTNLIQKLNKSEKKLLLALNEGIQLLIDLNYDEQDFSELCQQISQIIYLLTIKLKQYRQQMIESTEKEMNIKFQIWKMLTQVINRYTSIREMLCFNIFPRIFRSNPLVSISQTTNNMQLLVNSNSYINFNASETSCSALHVMVANFFKDEQDLAQIVKYLNSIQDMFNFTSKIRDYTPLSIDISNFVAEFDRLNSDINSLTDISSLTDTEISQIISQDSEEIQLSIATLIIMLKKIPNDRVVTLKIKSKYYQNIINAFHLVTFRKKNDDYFDYFDVSSGIGSGLTLKGTASFIFNFANSQTRLELLSGERIFYVKAISSYSFKDIADTCKNVLKLYGKLITPNILFQQIIKTDDRIDSRLSSVNAYRLLDFQSLNEIRTVCLEKAINNTFNSKVFIILLENDNACRLSAYQLMKKYHVSAELLTPGGPECQNMSIQWSRTDKNLVVDQIGGDKSLNINDISIKIIAHGSISEGVSLFGGKTAANLKDLIEKKLKIINRKAQTLKIELIGSQDSGRPICSFLANKCYDFVSIVGAAQFEIAGGGAPIELELKDRVLYASKNYYFWAQPADLIAAQLQRVRFVLLNGTIFENYEIPSKMDEIKAKIDNTIKMSVDEETSYSKISYYTKKSQLQIQDHEIIPLANRLFLLIKNLSQSEFHYRERGDNQYRKYINYFSISKTSTIIKANVFSSDTLQTESQISFDDKLNQPTDNNLFLMYYNELYVNLCSFFKEFIRIKYMIKKNASNKNLLCFILIKAMIQVYSNYAIRNISPQSMLFLLEPFLQQIYLPQRIKFGKQDQLVALQKMYYSLYPSYILFNSGINSSYSMSQLINMTNRDSYMTQSLLAADILETSSLYRLSVNQISNLLSIDSPSLKQGSPLSTNYAPLSSPRMLRDVFLVSANIIKLYDPIKGDTASENLIKQFKLSIQELPVTAKSSPIKVNLDVKKINIIKPNSEQDSKTITYVLVASAAIDNYSLYLAKNINSLQIRTESTKQCKWTFNLCDPQNLENLRIVYRKDQNSIILLDEVLAKKILKIYLSELSDIKINIKDGKFVDWVSIHINKEMSRGYEVTGISFVENELINYALKPAEKEGKEKNLKNIFRPKQSLFYKAVPNPITLNVRPINMPTNLRGMSFQFNGSIKTIITKYGQQDLHISLSFKLQDTKPDSPLNKNLLLCICNQQRGYKQVVRTIELPMTTVTDLNIEEGELQIIQTTPKSQQFNVFSKTSYLRNGNEMVLRKMAFDIPNYRPSRIGSDEYNRAVQAEFKSRYAYLNSTKMLLQKINETPFFKTAKKNDWTVNKLSEKLLVQFSLRSMRLYQKDRIGIKIDENQQQARIQLLDRFAQYDAAKQFKFATQNTYYMDPITGEGHFSLHTFENRVNMGLFSALQSANSLKINIQFISVKDASISLRDFAPTSQIQIRIKKADAGTITIDFTGAAEQFCNEVYFKSLNHKNQKVLFIGNQSLALEVSDLALKNNIIFSFGEGKPNLTLQDILNANKYIRLTEKASQ